MSNPARELARILDGWGYGKGKSPQQARKEYAQSRGMAEDAVARRALGSLVEIESVLADLTALGDDVGMFTETLPHWQSGLLNAATRSQSAQAGQTATAIGKGHLDLLKALSTLIESKGAALRPSPATVADIEAAIAGAEEFVCAVDILEETRHYLLGLLARIRSAVRDGRPTELRSAVNEYVGATTAVERANPGEAGRWAKAREGILQPILNNAVGGVLTQGVVRMIGLIGQ
jgi:hypothetical protein